MIDVQPKVERALLVGAPRRGTKDAQQVEEHLDELASLADTAGAEVVGRLHQQVPKPAPNFYIGKGKVAELKVLLEEKGATLVIFDEELTPAQGKNLEEELGTRVMDRAELILDIFATRARTREARMEVELAQLEYTLPRLARMWVHLSRIRGGIGLRGPGETQLETDRRMIRRKISVLKDKLEHVAQHHARIRQGQGRRDVKTAVLVGYTNAGKSSLLRALTGAEAFVENRLFATLDTQTREMTLTGRADGRTGRRVDGVVEPLDAGTRPPVYPSTRLPVRLRLIDTVGFIRKLPHHLVASFRTTLDEAKRADVLLHVIDAAHPDWEGQLEVVNRTLHELGVSEAVPLVHVFNKMDLVPEREAMAAAVTARFAPAVGVSAEKGEVGELVEMLGGWGLGKGETGSGKREA